MFRPLKNLLRSARRRLRKENTAAGVSGASRFWIGLTVAFAILFASFLFPPERMFAPPSMPQVGEIAAEDIIAPFDFPVYKTEEEMEFERLEAISSLSAVLEYDAGKVDSVFKAVDGLFHLADSLTAKGNPPQAAAEKLRLFFPEIKEKTLRVILEHDSLAQSKQIIRSSLQDRYIVGVAATDTTVPPRFQTVQVERPTRTSSFAADQVHGLEDAKRRLREDIEIQAGGESKTYIDALYSIAQTFLGVNLTFSQEKTTKRRAEAIGSISDEKMWFHAGQRLIAKNERVTETHLEWMRALMEHRAQTGTEAGTLQFLLPFVARIMFMSFIFLSFLLAYYHMNGREQFRLIRVIPLLLIMLLTVVSGYIITEQADLSKFLVPVATGIILTVILFNLRTAILATVAEALLFGVLYEFNFEFTFLVVIVGLTAAFSMRTVKRRSDFYSGALYLAIAYALSAYIFEALSFSDTNVILRQCGYGVANAAASSFIAMAILPLFESLFAFTTNITLLELSDMNHPLLKRLALESPGTYHHSLVIGTLTENAAEAIGANSLLARIGAYYHDVGKMEISEYFVENQFGVKSKHEELAPSMSAIVIKSHITRGRELAEEYDLPDAIIDFIEEHHGTSLMSYFYNKAKELHPDEEVSEAEYRYPGPKPQSKETAILMIADSVEAASRTLEDPKASRIRSLVRRLINDKVQSGQLSESNLTLKDLQGIEDAFVKVLIGVFHSRIEYPKKEEEESTPV